MTVHRYRTPSGNDPVAKYLDALPAAEAGDLLEHLEEISRNGLGVAVTRQLRGPLREIKYDKHRIAFVALAGGRVVLLHAFRKSSQKAPPREVDLALSRMKEVLAYEP
jgi:phage-related protein